MGDWERRKGNVIVMEVMGADEMMGMRVGMIVLSN